MPGRSSIYLLWLIAVLGWSTLLLYTRFVPPNSPLSFGIFFLLFSVALVSSLAPLTYTIEQRIFPRHHYYLLVRYALRQSALLTLAIVLNLIFLALHSWNVFIALVILLAAVILEVLFLARK